jgi:lipopolysaccharide heptosyltransferase II
MEHSEFSYLFLNERIRAVDMNLHAVRRELMLLESIGIPAGEVSFPLPVGRPEREAALRLLDRHGIRKNDPFRIAVNPIARWDTKLWSETNFAVLADRIVDTFGATPVFTGSDADRPAITRITRMMRGRAVNLAGETTLPMLAALYAGCHVVVSTDTGPMHLAAAVGTPVVALFGPTAPWRTGPFGKKNRIVRTEIACSPCFKRKCPTNECMARISVSRVLSEIGRIKGDGSWS